MHRTQSVIKGTDLVKRRYQWKIKSHKVLVVTDHPKEFKLALDQVRRRLFSGRVIEKIEVPDHNGTSASEGEEIDQGSNCGVCHRCHEH